MCSSLIRCPHSFKQQLTAGAWRDCIDYVCVCVCVCVCACVCVCVCVCVCAYLFSTFQVSLFSLSLLSTIFSLFLIFSFPVLIYYLRSPPPFLSLSLLH